MAEHAAVNREVLGSSPSRRAKKTSRIFGFLKDSRGLFFWEIFRLDLVFLDFLLVRRDTSG